MSPSFDFSSITELPGARVSQEQIARFAHRYATGVALARGRRVLEVACGAGAGLGCLQQEASSLAGLDATEALLHAVRVRYEQRLRLACADAQRLPIVDGAFDLVLCFEAIYYMADHRKFLYECRRVLADRGLLLIVYSNPDWPHFVPGSLSIHYPSVPELAHAMEAAGFRNVRFSGILPATSYTVKQKVINRVRRYVTRSNLLPHTGILANALKQFSYGQLFTLPPIATPQMLAQHAAGLTPEMLPAHQIDRVHRVVYASGET